MSKVSIVVPIYNVEKYLDKCLESLINQTFKDIEILAVSDGSLDNSMSIVEEYANKDKRIIGFEKENGGYGSVLEFTISKIQSKYFLICDPDDWLEKNAIETLYNEAEKRYLDICIGCKNIVYNKSSRIDFSDTRSGNCNNIKEDVVYEDMSDLFFIEPSPHAKLYKTKICKDIKFPKKVNYTDNILYLEALNKSKRAMYIKKPLANYLVDRPGNSTVSLNEKSYKDQIVVLNALFNGLNDNKYKNQTESCLLYDFFAATDLLKNGSKETKKNLYPLYLEFAKKFIKNKRKTINGIPNLSLKNKIYYHLLLNENRISYLYKRMINL